MFGSGLSFVIALLIILHLKAEIFIGMVYQISMTVAELFSKNKEIKIACLNKIDRLSLSKKSL